MLKQIGKYCKRVSKCKIIGAIVFSNLPPGGDMLPSNIQYKIRVHARGEVELTKWMFPHIRFRSTTPRRFKKEGEFQQFVPLLILISRNSQIYLTRFAIQAKGPDGKWTRMPLAYRESNNVHLLIARPPEICVNLVFKHIHAASSYTICRQFVPFIYCPL